VRYVGYVGNVRYVGYVRNVSNSLNVPHVPHVPSFPTLATFRRSPRSVGFTLIEVMIALVILAVGVLALTGSSATINRMIGRGKVETQAALLASGRVEELRLAAASTSPRCSSAEFASGGPVWAGGLKQTWVVEPSGNPRRVRVTVSYLTIRGVRSAVLETAIQC
jgi:type II secretion system protein I